MIELQPLVSREQHSFLDGEITAEQYLNLAQYEAELVSQRAAERRSQKRLRVNGLIFFSGLGMVAYVIAAAIFSFSRNLESALKSLILCVGCVAMLEVLREVRRRIRE